MYETEVRRARDYLLSVQKPDGSFPSSEDGLNAHYKMPCALLEVGAVDAAGHLLDWIKANQLRPDGDFCGTVGKFCSTWHHNFYTYANSWIIIGAQRMLRFDISLPAIEFVAGLQDERTGGFHHAPPRHDESDHLNTLVTSWAGMAMLTCGRMDRAQAAGRFLVTMLERQPAPRSALLLTTRPGTIEPLESLPPDIVESGSGGRYERVDSQTPDQRYFHMGIQALLLGRLYMATGEEMYLATAGKLIDFFHTCAPDRMHHLTSCKVGVAAALLYQITGTPAYRQLALDIGAFLASIQLDDGSWVPAGLTPDDCPVRGKCSLTSELLIWLKHISVAVQEPCEA